MWSLKFDSNYNWINRKYSWSSSSIEDIPSKHNVKEAYLSTVHWYNQEPLESFHATAYWGDWNEYKIDSVYTGIYCTFSQPVKNGLKSLPNTFLQGHLYHGIYQQNE